MVDWWGLLGAGLGAPFALTYVFETLHERGVVDPEISIMAIALGSGCGAGIGGLLGSMVGKLLSSTW